jgi:hypothetical protein
VVVADEVDRPDLPRQAGGFEGIRPDDEDMREAARA